ncbi:histidine kinase [Pedobacter sp. MW01-1-1]|uniref:histidine kinase n=1 Tax=Pedobacter sp. MW01-1-1 TaxID=3383027 RepID=UPI003FF0E95E
MKKTTLSFLLVLCFVLALYPTVFGQKIITISDSVKRSRLLNQAEFAVSSKNNTTLAQLDFLEWKAFDDSVKLGSALPDSTLQYWLRFTLKNTYPRDTILLLKLGSNMQKSVLYEQRGKQLVLVAQTGLGSRISDLSIKTDYLRLSLPLRAQAQQRFYLLNHKYLFNLTLANPAIETLDMAYLNRGEELLLSPSSYRNVKLWVAGFYFAVFIYCCLKFFFQRKHIDYLYYALASISLFLRYSLQVDAIVLESSWWPSINNDFIYLLSFVPQNFFYILFLINFLSLKDHKYLFAFANFCLLQWVVMLGVMGLHYARPELTIATKILWMYSALPFLVLTILLSYYARPNSNRGYLKFAFIGLVTISVAFTFSVVPKWINLTSYLPNWYYRVNQYIDLITVAFVLDTILFLTALAYRDKQGEIERINLKLKNAENEHKILRLQMNPHFIFNCLNSINLYIEQNDNNLASGYLKEFSQLMRLSLVHSRAEKIVLSEELTVLRLYLELETMRFKGKLNYAIEVDKNVDVDFIEIPPMLIQPQIENAIWHGLMHKKEGGKINIKINQDTIAQSLQVIVEDNGVGRAKAAELNSKNAEKEKSYGSVITNERIAVLNQKFNANTTLHVEDLYNENYQPMGTRVTINIHLI